MGVGVYVGDGLERTSWSPRKSSPVRGGPQVVTPFLRGPVGACRGGVYKPFPLCCGPQAHRLSFFELKHLGRLF